MTTWTPAGLSRLHARCFTTPRPWSEAEFEEILGEDASFLITRPEGFLLALQVLDEVEVLTIAVAPAARQQGHGLAMFGEFERRAMDLGCKKAFLEVATDNLAAKALYAAAGYRQVGRRPRYYRKPDGGLIDAEILCKQLG
ncbi:GNAT family N-acetyltransferase [Pseudooceanicola algae]|uniref:Uncharacterized protein n=1 Tax=Pseudooceanicola algae TaxID=1537215 RepID=A0A418SKS7_9RHOB|nr:GNAT family N-acetyltransferase [Pseudooceanicola algae]QPM90998.1 hypothetical protein PSAL_022410 [Pseudooceanicola algae]